MFNFLLSRSLCWKVSPVENDHSTQTIILLVTIRSLTKSNNTCKKHGIIKCLITFINISWKNILFELDSLSTWKKRGNNHRESPYVTPLNEGVHKYSSR